VQWQVKANLEVGFLFVALAYSILFIKFKKSKRRCLVLADLEVFSLFFCHCSKLRPVSKHFEEYEDEK
jgi:hypothetical protein